MKTVLYYMENCSHCKELLANKNKFTFKFDKEREYSNTSIYERQQNDLQSYPTIIVYDDDGKILDKLSGFDKSNINKINDWHKKLKDINK